jgi:hypothetical protein
MNKIYLDPTTCLGRVVDINAYLPEAEDIEWISTKYLSIYNILYTKESCRTRDRVSVWIAEYLSKS